MTNRTVVLGTDHAGFALKEELKAYLMGKGYDVIDTGASTLDPDDSYVPIMRRAAEEVVARGVSGIILGGSGNGEAIVANKQPGIRAAVCYSEEITRLARTHNDANIMSIGARFMNTETAKKLVDIFLETPFEGGRHTARVRDIEPNE